MTSSDREQLVWFLVEAELEEGRLSDMWSRAKDYGARGRSAVQGAADEAGAFFLGAKKHPAVVIPAQKLAKTDKHKAVVIPAQRIAAERGVPGYKGTQAYGWGVSGVREAGRLLGAGRERGAALIAAAPGAARAAGGFVSAGARGQGIKPAVADFMTARRLGDAGKTARGVAMRQFGSAAGRSAAVYGGAAALTAGGALGARALYRRHKARKARRQEQE